MMKAITTALSLGLFIVPTVYAHGRVDTVTIDGQKYTGPGFNDNTDSVVRMITTPSPVKDLTADDMICGQGAASKVAALSAAAKPGSTVTYTWASGSPPIDWPHNVGPIMTYITSCGGDCKSFSGKDAKWTKIDEAGRPNNATTGDWIQALTYHVGKSYSLTLPSDLPDGQYLLRHEIIALHNAQSEGGAEIYPSCTQITVTGGSNAKISVPSSGQVTFPGAYSATDPGILVDVYSGALTYQFPGGSLFTDVTGSGSGSSSSGSGGSSNSTTSSTSASLTATTSKATATPTTTSSAAAADSTDDGDCDDGGSDDGTSDDGTTDSGDDTVTVTITQTVTVTPTATSARKTKTATDTLTVTATATSDSVNVAARMAQPTGVHASGNMYPRRISRIMGRRSHM